MRVVVFGGAGFVGLNVADALLAAGHEVHLFDRLDPPERFVAALGAPAKGLSSVVADIRDPTAVAEALAGADAAVQAAAVTSDADRERADARSVLAVNLMGWLAVLEGARRHGLGRILNLGSASAYGAAAFRGDTLGEAATAPDPDTLYSLSKFAAERVGDRLEALWGIDVLSVRLSSVFGPWERATGVRDSLSPPFQVMRAALTGRPVRFTRDDVRDWVYAPDIGGAVVDLLALPRPRHRLYNLSPGRSWSLLAWSRRLAARHFPDLEPAVAPAEATIATHMPTPRRPLRVDRLGAEVDLSRMRGLDATADDYAAWALAHREIVMASPA